ncbi:MAG TPA: LUD domain-containing protein [Pirellulales bacterium]|nr:LUD domain-containing protein [Pirellulales bacterium]
MNDSRPTDAQAKASILAAIRRHPMAAQPLPDLAQPWIRYEDPVGQFIEVLTSVGGRCIAVRDLEHLQRELAESPEYAEARQICSHVPGVGASNVDLDAIDDPHSLETVDYAILPGEFGVAENGAIWVSDAGVKHRVIYVIAQHLALVVPADKIVHNLHEAYRRLSFGEPRFGVFISGPSKTADIEQSLVIGAHGPRSLTVFLMTGFEEHSR